MKIISHGDVNLHPITKEQYEAFVKSAKPVTHKGEFVLALGEVTGHRHVIVAEPQALVVHELPDGRGRLFMVAKDTQITHEQHHALPVKEGYYIQVMERELDHFASSTERKVID